jgi:hypothetical protein
MDPYLERYWEEILGRLVVYAGDQLTPSLPGELCARVQERILLETPDAPDRVILPDVAVVERRWPASGTAAFGASGIALAESTVVHVPYEPIRQKH